MAQLPRALVFISFYSLRVPQTHSYTLMCFMGESLSLIRNSALHFFIHQLNRPNPPDVNCSDQLGNTPLHCAAYRAHKQCALKLLKSGADPNLKNKNGKCVSKAIVSHFEVIKIILCHLALFQCPAFVKLYGSYLILKSRHSHKRKKINLLSSFLVSQLTVY